MSDHETTPALPGARADELAQTHDSGVRPPVVERVVRSTDIDERAARRTERQIAGLFLLSAVATAGFIAAFVGTQVHSVDNAWVSNITLGSSMTVAFIALASGIILWVRRLMPADETVQERHELRSSDAEREETLTVAAIGLDETGLPRRSLIKRSLGLSLGLLALPPVFLLRDLGPLPREKLRVTPWQKGSLLLEAVSKRPVKVGDLEIGGMVTVLPPEAETEEDIAKSAVVLIRLTPGDNHPLKGREGWAYQDHVAYSKICTHLGCPVGLYEQTTRHLLCPCHQSTFDVTRGCDVVFGPAARRLPQLPIDVDDQGRFIATAPFDEPVGPSFWERG